jgi:stage II sporulation protein D
MKRIKKYKLFMSVICSLGVILSACTADTVKENVPIQENLQPIPEQKQYVDEQDNKIDSYKPNIDIPVSRALAAKMIALTFNDSKDIRIMEREIDYEDSNPQDWYDMYVNAVTVQGFMNGSGKQFRPLDPLTYEQAQILLKRLSKDKINVIMKINEEQKKQYISYQDWVNLYMRLIEKMIGEETKEAVYGMKEKTFTLIATPANNETLDSWEMATDKGIFGFSGLPMDAYLDQTIKFLLKDNEIVAFLDVVDITPTVTNAYITATS